MHLSDSVSAHKAIVATGSQYMLEVFCSILPGEPENNPLQISKEKFEPKDASAAEGPYIEVPLPMQTRQCTGQSLDEDLNRILRYIYSN